MAELDKSNIDNYSNDQLVYFFKKHWIGSLASFAKDYHLNKNIFRTFVHQHFKLDARALRRCSNAVKIYLQLIGIPQPHFYVKMIPTEEEMNKLFYIKVM